MMANENKINWTLVVLGTILCIGLYLVPSPLQSTHRIVVHTHDSTWVVLGTPDTSGIHVPPFSGSSSSNTTIKPPVSDTSSAELPYFYTEVKDSTKEGDKISIQVYTYPYEEADTLKAFTNVIWEIQPRPAIMIQTTDTLYVMNPQIVDVPLYEKPYVVAPVTAAVVIGLVYIIAEAFK